MDSEQFNPDAVKAKQNSWRGRALPVVAAVSLVLSLLLAGVSSSAAESAKQSAKKNKGSEIPVGMVAPLTGIGASAGVGALEGAEVAISGINGSGGVLGRKINLIIGNDNTDPVDAVPVVQQQISVNHVVASYGPAANTWPATRHLYDNAGIPVIVWGGEDLLPHLKDPLVFRDTPADSVLGVAMAAGAWQLGYRRAAVLFGTDTNGARLGATVKAAWTKLGGKIVANVSYNPGETTYRSVVQKIVSAQPQVILFRSLATTAGALFSALNQLEPGGLSIPMVGDTTAAQPDFTKAIGLAASQKVVYSTTTGTVTGPGVTLFNQQFMKIEGTAPLSQANFAYDGVNMIALAIERAKSTSGNKIAKAIATDEVSSHTHCYSFKQCLSLLKAHKEIKYVGVSGPLTFNKYHHVLGPFAIYRAQNVTGSLKRIVEIPASLLSKATPK
jgi:branched-chain amino acid transport system substrate-binding protein